MFVPFLIMFREGLEAALIVSLIASYLKRTQRSQWLGAVWIGVIVAAALCLALGIFINETTGEFRRSSRSCSRIVAVVAVGILTYMVFWMRKVSKSVKMHLEGRSIRRSAPVKGRVGRWWRWCSSPWRAKDWSRCSSCWRRSSKTWAPRRRSARCSAWWPPSCWA